MIRTCINCGHTDNDVNGTLPLYLGGAGLFEFPCCDDVEACAQRSLEQFLTGVPEVIHAS